MASPVVHGTIGGRDLDSLTMFSRVPLAWEAAPFDADNLRGEPRGWISRASVGRGEDILGAHGRGQGARGEPWSTQLT